LTESSVMASSNKTVPTTVPVRDFLAAAAGEDPQRLADCQQLVKVMQTATGEKPVMWGPSIVGFGTYRYVYDSGRSGTSPLVGFSPRKGDIVVYVVPGVARYEKQLAALGRHKTGKVCLYLKRLADVDLAVLEQIVADSVQAMAALRVPTERVH
jgi:hypothetical protein